MRAAQQRVPAEVQTAQRLWAGRFALLLLLLVSACASEPPPVPPAELQSTTGDVTLLRLWSAKAGEAGRGRFEPWIGEDQIVVANGRGKLTAYAPDNGMRLWTRELDVRLSSGIGGADGQLYVTDTDGVVHAISASNGEPLWEARMSSEVLVPVAAGFNVVVVRSTDGRVVALDPVDASELWSASNTPPALSLNGYSRPLLLDGGLLIGLDDGRLLALDISSGKEIWQTVVSVPAGRSEVERLVDIDADILVDSEGIYVANYQGKAARIEPVRGQIVWSVPLSAGSGIALNAQSLVIIDDADTVYRLDKQTGQILWKNETMPGRRLGPPSYTPSGDVVIGDVEGFVHVLDLNSGASVGRTRLGKDAIKARPILRDNAVYVQSIDGTVAAYRFAR